MHCLREDGFVLLEGAIASERAAEIAAVVEERTDPLEAAQQWGGAAAVRGHVEHDLNTDPPLDIGEDPLIAQIVRASLGESHVSYYACNTNCPGSELQPLHRDGGPLHLLAKFRLPALRVLHPPGRIVMNVLLGDVDETNGATELWPGTHRIPRITKWVRDREAGARRQEVPPVRACGPCGTVVLRYFDLWHRGVPNESRERRHMLAVTHEVPRHAPPPDWSR